MTVVSAEAALKREAAVALVPLMAVLQLRDLDVMDVPVKGVFVAKIATAVTQHGTMSA